MELSVENRHRQILVLKGGGGTVTLNPGRGNRDKELLLGLNVVLSLLGMEVFVQQQQQQQGEEEEQQQQQQQQQQQEEEEWVVRKGSWSQVLEDGMTVSAFASREWPKIASRLQMLPKYVTKEHLTFVAPAAAPPPPPAPAVAAEGVSVLGKRGGGGEEGGEGGEEGGLRGGGPGRGGGGGRGRGRGGRGVNLWAGSNKWVRT